MSVIKYILIREQNACYQLTWQIYQKTGGGSSETAPLVQYSPCKPENLSLMTRIHVKSREWWHAFVVSALGTGGFHEAHWPADPPDDKCTVRDLVSKTRWHLWRNNTWGWHLASCARTHAWNDMYTYIHVPAHTQIYIQYICICGELPWLTLTSSCYVSRALLLKSQSKLTVQIMTSRKGNPCKGTKSRPLFHPESPFLLCFKPLNHFSTF